MVLESTTLVVALLVAVAGSNNNNGGSIPDAIIVLLLIATCGYMAMTIQQTHHEYDENHQYAQAQFTQPNNSAVLLVRGYVGRPRPGTKGRPALPSSSTTLATCQVTPRRRTTVSTKKAYAIWKEQVLMSQRVAAANITTIPGHDRCSHRRRSGESLLKTPHRLASIPEQFALVDLQVYGCGAAAAASGSLASYGSAVSCPAGPAAAA